MKTCSNCEIEKDINLFSKNKTRKDNHTNICKECHKIYRKTYDIKNREKISKKQKEWNLKNYQKMVEYRKKYQQNNKLIIETKRRIRRKTNINYRLKCQLRTRLNSALKGNFKSGSSVNDLGCSIQFLKSYLESKFQQGMTWENYGRYGWHIDHVIPLSKFNLNEREQLLKAVHYTNLQPMWWNMNLAKSNK